jgi:hypothetical protein
MNNAKEIRGRNGSTFIVGSEGLEVGDFQIRKKGKLIAEATAIDIFDFAMKRLAALLDYSEKEMEERNRDRHLVRSTISQLAIVTLASALETYAKKRLTELERSARITDWNEVLRDTGLSSDELQRRAKTNSRTALEELIEERRLNLLSVDEFGRLFEQGCGIKVSDIPRSDVYRVVKLRHDIVHGGLRLDTLYYDKGMPVFATPSIAKQLASAVNDFIHTVHQRSTLTDTQQKGLVRNTSDIAE